MYINYNEKLALADLSEILRPLVQPAGAYLSARDVAQARKRLERLTPAELLDLLLQHRRQGIAVLPRMPDRLLSDPPRSRPVGRFPESLVDVR